MTAQEIRDRYPNPVTADQGTETTYCVGGALCQYLADQEEDQWQAHGFPMVIAIADVLQEANEHLTIRSAVRRAKGITVANDAGLFDRAWRLLDLALKARH